MFLFFEWLLIICLCLVQDCGLLKVDERPGLGLSSAERSLRHGEVRLLKSMKQTLQQEAPRKRRTLKPDTWVLAEDKDKADLDIRDIDFRLRNDNSQLQVNICCYPVGSDF